MNKWVWDSVRCDTRNGRHVWSQDDKGCRVCARSAREIVDTLQIELADMYPSDFLENKSIPHVEA